jgi:hypothetical protein
VLALIGELCQTDRELAALTGVTMRAANEDGLLEFIFVGMHGVQGQYLCRYVRLVIRRLGKELKLQGWNALVRHLSNPKTWDGAHGGALHNVRLLWNPARGGNPRGSGGGQRYVEVDVGHGGLPGATMQLARLLQDQLERGYTAHGKTIPRQPHLLAEARAEADVLSADEARALAQAVCKRENAPKEGSLNGLTEEQKIRVKSLKKQGDALMKDNAFAAAAAVYRQARAQHPSSQVFGKLAEEAETAVAIVDHIEAQMAAHGGEMSWVQFLGCLQQVRRTQSGEEADVVVPAVPVGPTPAPTPPDDDEDDSGGADSGSRMLVDSDEFDPNAYGELDPNAFDLLPTADDLGGENTSLGAFGTTDAPVVGGLSDGLGWDSAAISPVVDSPSPPASNTPNPYSTTDATNDEQTYGIPMVPRELMAPPDTTVEETMDWSPVADDTGGQGTDSLGLLPSVDLPASFGAAGAPAISSVLAFSGGSDRDNAAPMEEVTSAEAAQLPIAADAFVQGPTEEDRQAPTVGSSEPADATAAEVTRLSDEIERTLSISKSTPVEWAVQVLVSKSFIGVETWEERVLRLEEGDGIMHLCGPRDADGKTGAVTDGAMHLHGCTVSDLKSKRNHNGSCEPDQSDQSAFLLTLAQGGGTFKMVAVPHSVHCDGDDAWRPQKNTELRQLLERLSSNVPPLLGKRGGSGSRGSRGREYQRHKGHGSLRASPPRVGSCGSLRGSLEDLASGGWLLKAGQYNSAFKRRFFRLEEGRLLKYYDAEPTDGHHVHPKGEIDLDRAAAIETPIKRVDGEPQRFKLITEEREWDLKWEDGCTGSSAESWREVLLGIVKRSSLGQRLSSRSGGGVGSLGGFGSLSGSFGGSLSGSGAVPPPPLAGAPHEGVTPFSARSSAC